MIKKNWLSLVFVLFFLTVGSSSAWAVDLTIESVTVAAGATFNVKVSFSEDTPTQGGEANIAYDDTVLTFNQGDSTVSSEHGFSSVGIVGDNIKVSIAGMETVAAPDNVIATLNFTAAADASGTSDITFANVTTEFEAFTLIDGVVTFAVNPQVTGIVGANGGMTVDGADAAGVKTFAENATPVYTVAPNAGFRVAVFKVDNVDATLTDGTTYTFAALQMGDNKTIEVTFEVIPLPTVTATFGAGGTIADDGTGVATGTEGQKQYAIGAAPVYTVSPEQDYKVATFTVGGTDAMASLVDNTYTFAALTEGAAGTINATFVAIVYPTVTATVGENGELTVEGADATGEKTYEIGDTPIYTVVPATGYKVDTFTVNGEVATLMADNTYTFAELIEADTHTVGVTFVAVVYPTITGTVGENGTLTVNDEDASGEKTYGLEEAPIYKVTPDTGYKVGTFTVNGAATDLADDNTYTFEALIENGVHTVGVTFVSIAFPTVTATVGANGSVTVDGADASGEKTYAVDQTVVYTVAPDADYEVDTFTVDDVVQTAGITSYTFTAMAEGETHTIDVAFKLSNQNSPVATSTDLTAIAGEVTTGTLVATDADEDALTYTITQQPEKGQVTLVGATYTYTANDTTEPTTDTFFFTVDDGKGGTDEGTITVNIVPAGEYSGADMDRNYYISLSELLSVQQLYTSGAYHCDPDEVNDDGYGTGDGDQTCTAHTSDYNPQDWEISLSEFLRTVQFYNLLGYHVAPEGVDSEDGFVAGPE